MLVVKWFLPIGNKPRSFSYELAIGIPHQLQVATLPCLVASSAKFLRSAYPKDGTSIMLCGWVQALMKQIALTAPALHFQSAAMNGYD